MALQINPWDDTYEMTLSYEEKVEAKRKHLALVKAGKIAYKVDYDGRHYYNHAGILPAHIKRVGSETEEDFMYTSDCPICGKESLLRIDYPVCTQCERENRVFLDFDDKSWYAKVRPIEDSKIKCPGEKYGVVRKTMHVDKSGFRRSIAHQSLLTHYVSRDEHELEKELDGQCLHCFKNIWKANTCHMCTKESSMKNSDLCKQCHKENPDYDPRESPMDDTLAMWDESLAKEKTINDAHASLQQRKNFYAKSDKEELKFLKSEKKKKSKEEKA